MKALLVLALALLPAPAKTLSFEGAVIARALPAPAECGVLKTWGAVDFTHDGVTNRAYIMCATADRLPAIGAHCSLTVTVSEIDGLTPDRRSSAYGAYAVDEIKCEPKIPG